MRWRSIGSEAWRNVASGTSRAVACALLLIAIGGATLALDLHSVAAITARAAAFHAAGADILVIEAPGRIDPLACEALGSTGGVTAGALRPAGQNLVAAALPGSSIPTFEVTQGVGAMLLEASRPGVLLSRAAADAFGARAELVTTLGPAAVGGVYEYPSDGRRPDLEYAVLVPVVATGAFDECWARSAASADDLSPLLLATVVPRQGTGVEAPTISQVNSSLGREFDGERQFAERPTRALPALGAGLCLVACAILVRLRRVELASALHSGVSRTALWRMLTLESLAPLLFVPLTAAATTAWVAADSPDALAYVDLAARSTALTAVAVLAGTTLGMVTVREGQLFASVKERQ